MAGGSKSSQSSRPVDMTPEAFRNLQTPFAQLLSGLLFGGLETTTTTEGGGGGTGGGTTGGSTGGSFTGSSLFPGAPSGGRSGGGGFPAGSASPGFVNPRDRPYYPYTAGLFGGRGQQPATTSTTSFNPEDVLGGIPRPEGGVAQITDAEQSILDSLQQFTGEGSGLDVARSTLEGIASGEGGNPFLEGAIEAATRTTRRGLEETLSRALPGRFTEAGQFTQPRGSSAFDRAAAIATEGASAEISDIAREMAFMSAEGERQRQLEAAVQLPGVSQQELDSLTTNLQAQALPRLIEQHGIDQGIEIFNNQMRTFLTTLGVAGNTAQPVIAQQSSGSSRTKPNVIGAL